VTIIIKLKTNKTKYKVILILPEHSPFTIGWAKCHFKKSRKFSDELIIYDTCNVK
jgi:hypothetical protein